MPGKFTAIAFLLLSSTLVLVHSIVPHHQHEVQVCFQQHACNHDHARENPGHHGADRTGAGQDCCILANLQLYSHIADRQEINCPCSDIQKDWPGPETITTLAAPAMPAPSVWLNHFRRTPFDDPAGRTRFAGLPRALRAPPLNRFA